jgi:RNA polymerase-associated protein
MSFSSRITLYVASGSYEADIIRCVVALKDVDCHIIEVTDPARQMARLRQLTGVTTLPALVDREVILTRFDIIIEYLEDRYPAPSLMPMTPSARANCRMSLHRMETELYPAIQRIGEGDRSEVGVITDTLSALGHLLSGGKFFCSDSLSIGDVTLGVLLYRAMAVGLNLLSNRSLCSYYSRLLENPALSNTLSQHRTAA